METVAHRRPPGFVAACVAAACANFAASWLFGLIALPLALATSTAVAFSGDRPTDAFRILVPWLLLVAAQPFVAAWIAQRGLAFFDAGRVTSRVLAGQCSSGWSSRLARRSRCPPKQQFPWWDTRGPERWRRLSSWPADARELASARIYTRKNPRVCEGLQEERMMGLEPTTFCMASRRSSQLSYIRTRRS